MTRTQQSEATNLCGVRFEFDESSVSYCECMWRERERDPGIHIQKRERERDPGIHIQKREREREIPG